MPAPTFPMVKNWPVATPLAVSTSVMLEGWTADAAPGAGPIVAPLKPGYYDHQARSWGDYGARTGAWRILEVLNATETKAVFYVSGLLASEYPDLLSAIVNEGHVVAAHGWAQNIIPVYLEREEESEQLQRSMRDIETACGVRPKGFISPRATPSANTSELLAAAGFQWTADVFDRDLPYLIETPKGRIAGVPFTLEVNDMPISIRYGNAPQAFSSTFERIVTEWHELGSPAATMDLTVHAHVFGHPSGAIEFKKAIQLARRSDVCWMTSHEELSARCHATFVASAATGELA